MRRNMRNMTQGGIIETTNILYRFLYISVNHSTNFFPNIRRTKEKNTHMRSCFTVSHVKSALLQIIYTCYSHHLRERIGFII